MTQKIATLAAELSLQNEQFIKAIGDSSKRLEAIQQQAKKTNDTFSSWEGGIKRVGAALVAGFASQKLIGGFKNIIDGFDELAKASQKAGVSAEALQKLQYAAELSGVSAGTLQTAIGKLSVGLSNVEDASSESAKALKALGLTAKSDVQEAMGKIADRFKAMPDGAAKTAEAIKLFGKSGADLIPLLNGGSEAIAEMAAEAERLGIVISEGTLKMAEEFNDNLTRMQKAAGAIGANITAGMLPALVGITEGVKDLANSGDAWQEFGRGAGTVLLKITEWSLQLGGAVKALGMLVGAVGAAIASPTQAKSIFKAWAADVDAMDAKLKESIKKMYDERDKREAAAASGTGTPASTPRGAVAPLTGGKGAGAAAKALEAEQKAVAQLELQYAKLVGSMTAVQELEKKRALGLADSKGPRAQLEMQIAVETDHQRSIAEWIKAAEQQHAAETKQREQTFADKAKAHEAEMQQLRELAAALDEQNKLRESLADWVSSELDVSPQDRALSEYLKKIEMLSKATNELNLSAETVARLQKKFLDEMNAGGSEWLSMVGKMREDFATGLTNAFLSADKGFKQFAASFLKQIAAMLMRTAILKALTGGIGGGGGMGNLREMFAGILGPVALAKGGATSGAIGLPWGVYDKPTFFRIPGSGMLQKFAKGGVLGEAGPEAIMPLRRDAGGRLGVEATTAAVNVNVHNNAGASVSVEQDGNDINIIIERVRSDISRSIRQGGNAVSAAFESTYRGLRRGAV